MRRKNNYVASGLDTPTRVTFPNGRTFFDRDKHVSRAYLVANIILKRGYRQRAALRGRRRRQRDWGLLSFVKKLAKDSVVISLAKEGIKHLPGLYNDATCRINNDKITSALQSHLAKRSLNKAADRYKKTTGLNKVDMLTKRIEQGVQKKFKKREIAET